MSVRDLDERGYEIVHRCLQVAVLGDLYPDGEFETIFGVSRAEVAAILETWPNVDEASETTRLAINNSINNLLGYPHSWHDTWTSRFSFTPIQLRNTYEKWLAGSPGGIA